MEYVLTLTPTSYFLASSVVACFGIFPTSTFAVGAGALYGFELGLVLYVASASFGALLCYGATRTPSLRSFIFKTFLRKFENKIHKITRAVKKEGALYIAVLIRMSPVMPYTPASFILAFLDVPVKDFLIGTLIGLLPSSAPYVYMGSIGSSSTMMTAATDSSNDWNTQTIAMNLFGLLFTILLTWKVSKVVNEALGDDAQSDNDSGGGDEKKKKKKEK